MMLRERLEAEARTRVPESNRSVLAGRGDQIAGGIECVPECNIADPSVPSTSTREEYWTRSMSRRLGKRSAPSAGSLLEKLSAARGSVRPLCPATRTNIYDVVFVNQSD